MSHPNPLRAPYRIRTGPLELRCYRPEDAAPVRQRILDNLDHLRPFMPWIVHEPQTLDQKLDLLLGFRGRFDLGKDFVYGIFLHGSGEFVGGTGLHPRVGPGGLEIGYWIASEFTRQGHASRATAALTRVGIELMHARRIVIHCQPENHASLAIPPRIGFEREGLLRQALPWPDGTFRDSVSFVMVSDALTSSPCANAPIEAYDALDRQVL